MHQTQSILIMEAMGGLTGTIVMPFQNEIPYTPLQHVEQQY